MKRIVFAVALALASASAFASEELDIYTFLYQDAETPAERLAVLRTVADAGLDGAGALYATALNRLVQETPSYRTNAERDAADASARLLAGLLGEAKYAAAAGDLWRVVQDFQNPLVKADALIALGRTRSEEHLPLVARLLQDLNLQPAADPSAAEKVAFGAVISMEKYRAPTGYAPVFFASTGWYSKRVKDQAAATLPLIVDDPSRPLADIMRLGDFGVKLLATVKMDESKASAAAKAEFAVLSYGEGWNSQSSDVKERVTLMNLRKQSMAMFAKYGTPTAAVPLLSKSYADGYDFEEKLTAVACLALNKEEASAAALSSFLMALNAKRKSGGITAEDERMVRAVIPALGAVGHAKGRPALQAVEFVDWTNAVKILAADALKKIK